MDLPLGLIFNFWSSFNFAEIKELEKHKDFDPRVKISADDKVSEAEEKMPEKKEPSGREKDDPTDNLEGAFSLFSAAESEVAKPKQEPGRIFVL